MSSPAWGRRALLRLDLLAIGSSGEFRAAEKCLWCALLYFAALALPLALFRIFL
jgi:hypothetical protein